MNIIKGNPVIHAQLSSAINIQVDHRVIQKCSSIITKNTHIRQSIIFNMEREFNK